MMPSKRSTPLSSCSLTVSGLQLQRTPVSTQASQLAQSSPLSQSSPLARTPSADDSSLARTASASASQQAPEARDEAPLGKNELSALRDVLRLALQPDDAVALSADVQRRLAALPPNCFTADEFTDVKRRGLKDFCDTSGVRIKWCCGGHALLAHFIDAAKGKIAVAKAELRLFFLQRFDLRMKVSNRVLENATSESFKELATRWRKTTPVKRTVACRISSRRSSCVRVATKSGRST